MNIKGDIIKSNIVIGVSQVVQMLVTIARSKLIAVLVGSQGIALNAIFQSTLLMIYNIASCGIMQSGVRELSQYSANITDVDKQYFLSQKLSVFKTLVFFSGLFGLVICVILSYPISIASLGTKDYFFYFLILGLGELFYILTHGEMTILQGTRSLRYLAYSTIIGSVSSLMACIPCYYYLGKDGIAVSIFLGYFVFFNIYYLYTRKLNIKVIPMSIKNAFKQGKQMLSLGLVLMFGTTLVSVFTYLTNISIRAIGSLKDLGLYQGVSSITTQSIAIILAILASDFFPRVSALIHNQKEKNILINEQLKIVLSTIPAIVVVIICFSNLIIKLLLSDEFLEVSALLQILSLSLIFKGIWITMSYVLLAHGDRRRYFIYDALIGNGLGYVATIIAYKAGGLLYLGISSLVIAIIVSLILFFVVKKKYKLKLDLSTEIIIIIVSIFTIATYALSINHSKIEYILGGITILFCFYNLISGTNFFRSKRI